MLAGPQITGSEMRFPKKFFHCIVGVRPSRGYPRAPFEPEQSLLCVSKNPDPFPASRDNVLLDFRAFSRSKRDEECVELGDERTA